MSLIAASELAARLHDHDTVVCDVRFHLDDHGRGRREYDAAHVPGARFVDLHTELAGNDEYTGGGRHPLPTVERFAELLGRRGISPGSTVVAYDSAGGAIASRFWWMLRSIGHETVLVLDGGIGAWTAGGHPVTSEVPAVTPTTYPTPAGWTGIVDADDVVHEIDSGTTVIDARSADRFRGEIEPIDPRAGHIPGAINRFHGDTVGPDGTHRPKERLTEQFVGVGPSPIVYCGSGVTACHALLALSIVGIDEARLYPGSWSEWSAAETRPLATDP